MAVPNLVAVLGSIPVLLRLLREFEQRRQA